MHQRGQLMLMERMLGVVPHLARQMQEGIAAIHANNGGASFLGQLTVTSLPERQRRRIHTS